MNLPNDQKFWLIRMNYGGSSLAASIWNDDKVGFWLGSWDAKDFFAARAEKSPHGYLNRLQGKAHTPWTIEPYVCQHAKKFDELSPKEYVVVCFENAIHLARVTQGGLASDGEGRWNRVNESHKCTEVFKYRHIDRDTKKLFKLDTHLPDICRLISQVGRSTICEIHALRSILKIMVECPSGDTKAVRAWLSEVGLSDWLDLLSDREWESLCLAYLIIEHEFRPVGLLAGRTLKTVDLIGCCTSGVRIVAQCKKNCGKIAIDEEFLSSARELGTGAKVFYFAFGGLNELPEGVQKVDKSDIMTWFNSRKGAEYLRLFKGDAFLSAGGG